MNEFLRKTGTGGFPFARASRMSRVLPYVTKGGAVQAGLHIRSGCGGLCCPPTRRSGATASKVGAGDPGRVRPSGASGLGEKEMMPPPGACGALRLQPRSYSGRSSQGSDLGRRMSFAVTSRRAADRKQKPVSRARVSSCFESVFTISIRRIVMGGVYPRASKGDFR